MGWHSNCGGIVLKASSSKRNKVAGGAGVLVAVMVVVGCTTSGGGGDVAHRTSAAVVTPAAGGKTKLPLAVATAAPGPAQKLAGLDGSGRPAEEYQQVLDALAPRCTEGRSRLVDVVDATLRDLRRHGAGDVDAFGVLQQLDQAVPAAYAKVREAG